jgi:hypothetical protein
MKEGGVKIMKEGKDKIIFNFCKMNPIDYWYWLILILTYRNEFSNSLCN